MRAVVQRVDAAAVKVGGDLVGEIGFGLLVYLGAGKGDTEADAVTMAAKIAHLRIFTDADSDDDRMRASVKDASGAVLVVSQFTLFGDARKGRRPSFEGALEPKRARELYESLCEALEKDGLHVQSGRFGADMKVHSVGAGPVTILIDTAKVF